MFEKLKLHSSKVAYIVSHGLGPHYHQETMKDVRQAPAFTLGMDGATFKVNGVTKHVDLWVRHWSETTNRVEDSYLDTHEFGREPAVKQVIGLLLVLGTKINI